MQIAVYFYYCADNLQRSVMDAMAAAVTDPLAPWVPKALIDILLGGGVNGMKAVDAFKENFQIVEATITPEGGEPFVVWYAGNDWCGQVSRAIDASCLGLFPYTLQARCFPCAKNPPCIYVDY